MRFDSYHPAINLLFFAAALTGSITLRQPVFLGLSLLGAWCYLTKLRGWRGLRFGLYLLPCAVIYTLWYAMYHHFGVTLLQYNRIGNRITLEALLCGLSIALSAMAVLLWLGCVHAIFTTDKIVYLFGCIWPRLSLFLSIILRTVPRVKRQYARIATAQQAIGRGSGQGGIFTRLRNRIRILSIVLTWCMESFVTVSESMRCRGYTLHGRTAFSLYRFDNRDRSLVVALFAGIAVSAMAALLGQAGIRFDPRIVMAPVTPLSGVFYLAYAAFCSLPMALQIIGERRFARLQQGVSSDNK